MKTIDKLKIMLEAPPSTSIVAYKTFLKEMLEECEKYRWHDLRKNPDDLPDKDGIYMVCIIYPAEEKAVGAAFYGIMYGYKSGWNMLMPNDGNVIAWREIEPFEEAKHENEKKNL